jgi:hypothetical protein
MGRWNFFSTTIVSVAIAGCAVGAGPGRSHDDPRDAANDDSDETEAYGLFDADPMDGASRDGGTSDTRPEPPPSDATPEVVSIDVGPVDTAPVDTAPPDRCSGETDGAYCASRFGSGGLDVHDLVHCAAGATSSVDTCVAGCVDGATGADKCHADPCTTAIYGGLYCGQSTQNGFGGGITDWLYDCESSKTKSSTPCAKGCMVEPSGTEDKCL